MEEDAKRRWRVNYTKHIKQKRKVYQEGFLDLHISTSKVKLYDDCEKLLECRLLKNDEVVSSGETLTLSAYFVDVGDPEGDHKPLRELNVQGRDKKFSEQPDLQCRQRFGNRSFSSDGKINGEKKKAQSNCISPSHKIIREFKKRELERYGSPQSSPDTVTTKTKEWQVLYTTQLTQKAKKYHDGFLRLKICGSQGRQILLFDETRKLLDSRFLRRDEVIKSNESVTLDGHLVEIGELEESCEPLADLNIHRNNFNITGKSEAMHGQQNYMKTNKHDGKEFRKSDVSGYGAPQRSPDTKNTSTKEWLVMYTTQVTQKAKKYHDGFLRLAITGSFQRQVMLYDDGKRLLNSRFLKKDEIISSGESMSFDAHLVNIEEPLENHQLQRDVNLEGNNSNVVKKEVIMHGQQNGLKADRSAIKGKFQRSACSSKNADSTFSISNEASRSVPTDKPLRDASQILSILRRPMTVTSVNAGCNDNSTMEQLPSIKEIAVSDVDHKSYKNLNLGRPNEDTDTGNCPNLVSSVALSTCNGSQISKDTDIGSFDQSQLEVTAGSEEALVFTISSSGTCASHGPGNDERNSSEKSKTASKTEEFPSFDLGF